MTMTPSALIKRWEPIIAAASRQFHVSQDWVRAVMRMESGGRTMPRRSEITPRDLKDVLRNIVMFERVQRDPSRYRWRLIGTNLTSMAGDNTGKMFEETLPPELTREYLNVLFEKVITEKTPSIEMLRRIQRIAASL